MTADPLPSPARAGNAWSRDLLLLGAFFGALYLFALGGHPLTNPDEGRNAEIPREMLASGDWVTPRLNGVNYFEKPPLVYWCGAVGLKLFGANEWSMRMTPALFALGGVLLAYAAARRLYGREAGLAAAAVLGTSLLYLVLGQILILDMAVSVLMSATLFCFILGVRETPGSVRRWWFYGLYASAALATLTKGLMGFLVTGAVMFLWLLVFNQWKRLRPFYLPTGALLFLAIAAPWHVLVALRNPTWAHRYFVFEHWVRFTATGSGHPGPWWYFAPIVLLGLFPWTGFLWPAVRDALRGGPGDGLRASWARRKEYADAWFLVMWAAFIFLFFSLSHSKLAPYILPICPALAVLIGAWLGQTLRDNDAARLHIGLRVFAFVCGFLAVAFCFATLRPELVHLPIEQAAALKLPAFALAAVLLLGGLVAPWLAKTRGVRAALLGIVGTMTVFFVALQFAATDIQKPGTKALAQIVAARAQPGDRVMHYHDFFHDFTFYAQRVVDVVAFQGELETEEDAAARASGRFMNEARFRELWTQPGRIFVIARQRDVRELFADPTFHKQLLGETRDHTLFSNLP
ncbi:MAG TPA: glycosyltransferase family 39 protein [Opitutaceae bacterium]|nr:glycosyltransferase family 39 protein [Opitutaceae bacterium]